MNNYRITIQYDGGRYKGWQRLGNGENTIQGKIEKVLSELLGTKTQIIGCSRTDAGVHALAQVANFKTSHNFSKVQIATYLNKYLPQDISIINVELVPDDFHARYHAKEKAYLYKIWNMTYVNPFMRKYSMHIEKKLNVKKMRNAAHYLVGEHDFTAFSNAKTKKKTMRREIYSIGIEESKGFIEIRISGNGFLHNMVRKIVGVLIEVGLEEIDADTIIKIINSKERNQLNYLADACGLYLENIIF